MRDCLLSLTRMGRVREDSTLKVMSSIYDRLDPGKLTLQTWRSLRRQWPFHFNCRRQCVKMALVQPSAKPSEVSFYLRPPPPLLPTPASSSLSASTRKDNDPFLRSGFVSSFFSQSFCCTSCCVFKVLARTGPVSVAEAN